MTAKQLTRIGLFHIEEAILETLFQARNRYMRAADIPRELGISQSHDKTSWIVSPILYNLEKDGRVESRRNESGLRTGWKLTTREYNRRSDVSG